MQILIMKMCLFNYLIWVLVLGYGVQTMGSLVLESSQSCKTVDTLLNSHYVGFRYTYLRLCLITCFYQNDGIWYHHCEYIILIWRSSQIIIPTIVMSWSKTIVLFSLKYQPLFCEHKVAQIDDITRFPYFNCFSKFVEHTS